MSHVSCEWVMSHMNESRNAYTGCWGCGCVDTLQHNATHCNTLQHATHCNTLHHTCVQQQLRVDMWKQPEYIKLASHCSTLQRTAKLCHTLPHTATHCTTRVYNSSWEWICENSLNIAKKHPTATHCNILQNSVTHCNTLHHTATPCTKRVYNGC